MSQGERDHPLRRVLHDEVHARPYEALTAPTRATHLAFLSGEGAAAAERAHVAALCARFGAALPGEAAFVSLDLGSFRLRWERHTEFSTYTFFRSSPGTGPFSEPAAAAVPSDWLAGVPGQRLAAIHAELVAARSGAPRPDAAAADLGGEILAGSLVTDEKAAAWTDFRIGADGFERILVEDRGMAPRQAGRLLQRLFEIETYRILALLALPLARETAPALALIEAQLADIAASMRESCSIEAERELLARLTGLAAEVERRSAAGNYRFGAARAYYALVCHRIAELREARIAGVQTAGEFMDRRLAPAMRSCVSVAERLESLSVRIARAAQLLRTRVEVALEEQNRDLLESMNRRAQLQLRLQQTVEGLSVAAISYYVVGLVGYAAKAIMHAGVPLDAELAQGAAIPLVVLFVFLGVRRIRRLLRRDRG
ncbi:MAG TPA: DUF3422 domain-containing protein [Alphaproteobacteria bacterium]|jgi:uncharacterized membrane-anchored protein